MSFSFLSSLLGQVPWYSPVPNRLRYRLLGWRDLDPCSLTHGLDPGLLLLWAFCTEEVGADSSVLGLWGEAVRGTGPSLIYPVNSHL